MMRQTDQHSYQSYNWNLTKNILCYEIQFVCLHFCGKLTYGKLLNLLLNNLLDDNDDFLSKRRFLELCEIDASVLKFRAE